jgi:RND family efflux transporter MFP subunit
VNPQTVLTTVEGSAQLEIYVQVPAHELDRLEVGLPVEVLGPGGARLDETQLTFVAPRVDPRTQTILAKAPVEGPGLLSGRFVDARIVWERKAVPTVPPSAVIRVNDQPFVYVLGEESTVTQRPVRLGPLAEQRYVVEEGLREGERVVSAGILRLRDGAHVSIEQAPGNATAQRE